MTGSRLGTSRSTQSCCMLFGVGLARCDGGICNFLCGGTRIVENAPRMNNLPDQPAGRVTETTTSDAFADPALKRADLHCHSRRSEERRVGKECKARWAGDVSK